MPVDDRPGDIAQAVRARRRKTQRSYQDVVKRGQTHEARRQEGVAAARNFRIPSSERIEPPPGASRHSGIDRTLAELSGVPSLSSDIYWTLTHPKERLLSQERAANPQMIYPGMSGKGTSFVAGKLRARVAPQRVFRANNLEVSIPAARSRTGRTFERLSDKVARPVVQHTGLMRTETEVAGQELGRSTNYQLKVQRATADALKKVGRKLSDDQEYAIRVLAEGVTPEERVAHHIDLSAHGSKEEAIYHGIHADLSRKAAKYLATDVNGRLLLRPDAPKRLHTAWELFQRSGDLRETLLKDLAKISDEQIAARVHAPGRVMHGARWKQNEQIIQDALEASPARQEYFKAVDAKVPDPVQGNALKALFDAQMRSYAARVAGDPQAVAGLLERLGGVKQTASDELAGGEGMLYASWADTPPDEIPGTRGGPKNLGDLEKLDLPKEGAAPTLPALEKPDVIPPEWLAQRAPQSHLYYREQLKDYPELAQMIPESPTTGDLHRVFMRAIEEGNHKAASLVHTEISTLLQHVSAADIHPPVKVKGAVEFTPDQAVIHLTELADETTFVHELAHVVRRFGLTAGEEKRLLKWAGAKEGWDRAAEEKFARGIEAFLRDGDGPYPVKQAFSSLSRKFREAYPDGYADLAHFDLPDVPPHVKKLFDTLFGYKRQTGGRLLGAEDVAVGVAYAPTFRGMPISRLSQPHKAMAAYSRRMQGYFGGGRKRAMGEGPADPALEKAYKGSALLNGFFTKDVIGPKVDSAILASRMAAAHVARDRLAKAGTELPSAVTDIAVKVDPSVGVSDSLKAFWEKMASVEATGKKLDAKALDGVDFDLIEAARSDVMPAQIEGKDVRQIAAEILETQQPVENIVWVQRDFLEQSGLLHVPGASRLMKSGMNKHMRQSLNAAGISWDALNDMQKALILYLNPAYIPMNVAGNLVMNLTQQGIFMPSNLMRSSLMHRELEVVDRVTIDNLMGNGMTLSLNMRTGPGRAVQSSLGHFINMAVDLVPRRSAFLHEARASWVDEAGVKHAGIKKTAELKPLLKAAREGDKQAMARLEHIARRANDAIVDFERLSPFEREVVSRWIFFYPWLKGATRYSARFIAEHPIQAAGIAMAVEYAREQSDKELGPRPVYAEMDVPISTKTVGIGIPGTDIGVGLDQAVGEKTWKNAEGQPMVTNFRQALTATTPWELAQSGISFAGAGFTGKIDKQAGADVVNRLTPVPYAAGVALFGYDPFLKRKVDPGLKTFFSQLGPQQSPLADRYKRLTMSEEERKRSNEKAIHPRTKNQEWMRLGGGAFAPSGFNREVSQRRMDEQLPALERHVKEFVNDSKDAGLGEPPPAAMEDLQWKERLDDAVKRNMSFKERAVAAAEVFDARHHTAMARAAGMLQSEHQAETLYLRLRASLYPTYAQWHRQVDRVLDARLEQTG